jgi:hypothetical protein
MGALEQFRNGLKGQAEDMKLLAAMSPDPAVRDGASRLADALSAAAEGKADGQLPSDPAAQAALKAFNA